MLTKTSELARLISIAMLAILLMSIVPVIIKWSQANPATIGIVRLAVGAFGIGLLVLFSKNKNSISRKELFWLVLLGLFFSLHWYSYFLSIKLADASLAAIGVATYGVHLLLLSSWLNKDKLTLIDGLALLISFVGIFIASPSIDFAQTKLQGFLLAVLSGLLYACLPIINQRLTHLSTNTRALGQFGFALCAFLFLLPQANFELSVNDWIGLVTLGVVSTLVGHTLWLKASTELPSNLTAVIYYAYVPVAMILSFIFLNESMTWQKLVGAFLIIGANVMVIFFHQRTNNSL